MKQIQKFALTFLTPAFLTSCQLASSPIRVIELSFPAHPTQPPSHIASNSALQPLSDEFYTLEQTFLTSAQPFTLWAQTLLSLCQTSGGKIAFEILTHTQRLTTLALWTQWCMQSHEAWPSQALAYAQWLEPQKIFEDQEAHAFVSLQTWLQDVGTLTLSPETSPPDYQRMIMQLNYTLLSSPETLSTLFQAIVELPAPKAPPIDILKKYLQFFEQHQIVPAIHPWRYYEILATP